VSFNGSGTFQLNSGGLPYVTGTTISSTTANNLNTDLATGLSTAICKDGQTTITANLPMGTFRHTNVGAATARTDYARASQVQDSTLILIGSVAGTNTITGSLTPAITAYAAGQLYTFIPANTNTAATTININSVGARNVFWNGAACVGGEIRQNIPCLLWDDGTQFHIVGNGFNAPFLDTHPVVEGSADSTKKLAIEVDGLTTATTRTWTAQDRSMTVGIVLGTEAATTSGTSVDFTGIPAGVRRITIQLVGVSGSGTSSFLVQIGDAGGIENTGYTSRASNITASTASTAGFILNQAISNAADAQYGKVILDLENSTNNTWTSLSIVNIEPNSANLQWSSGAKSLSAVLDRVRLTTVNGTDTFDAGVANISYEF
jgi:hypothetical protein